MYDHMFAVFALAERKNRKQGNKKYLSAACPELVEGKAKDADCVGRINYNMDTL
jgi:hypothetical protein